MKQNYMQELLDKYSRKDGNKNEKRKNRKGELTIRTCYGCPYYYKDKEGYRYPVKHCNKDHLRCEYYNG